MLFGYFNKRQIKQDFIDYYGHMLVSETRNDIVRLIRYSLGVVSPLDVTHADLCERVNIDWKAIQRFTPSLSPNIWAGYTFAWSTVSPKSSEEAENACTIGTRSLNYSSRTDTSNKARISSIWRWKIERKRNFKLKIELDIFMKLQSGIIVGKYCSFTQRPH